MYKYYGLFEILHPNGNGVFTKKYYKVFQKKKKKKSKVIGQKITLKKSIGHKRYLRK